MLIFYLSLIEEANDIQYFELLFNKYRNLTLHYAESIVHNHYDTEDVCQEAWLDLSQETDRLSFENDVAERAYILKIVRNKALCFLRKEKNKRKHTHDYIEEEIEKNQELYDSTIASICRNESVAVIRACLNSMPEIYRDVLIFYYLDGLPVKEIARMADLDVKAVYGRMSRGRTMLMKLLVEKGEGGNE